MKIGSHEEIFIGLYSRLRGWAIQIAEKDHELAEDLLHDAFIQFTVTQPELDKILNTEAYLYGLIRNLHLSHVRKKARRSKYTSSIIDFETMRLGLKSAKFLDNYQVQEELKRICYFLCLRKESSKSASVMLFRFFHGYFPGEIASIMRAAPQVVKVRLNSARNEAKTVIENPQTIKTIEKRIDPEMLVKNSFRSNVELAAALREMIFRTTNGNCLEDFELREIYSSDEREAVETKILAHIVSCRKCIDKVNSLLNLLPLSQRYAADFIGKDNNGSGNGSGNGGGMNQDAENKVLLTMMRRGSQEVFEYEPKELLLAVNGDLKTSRKIEDALTDFSVELNVLPEFIEIYGENDTRLAFISLTDDAGDAERPRQFVFNFSDERKITVNLENESSKIILRAGYEDPHFAERQILSETFSEEISLAEFLSEGKSNKAGEDRIFGTLLDSRPKEISFIERLRNLLSFTNPKSLIAGGALAALAIAAIFIVQIFVAPPNISAAEIIRKTVEVERANETDAEKIQHRILNFEEKTGGGEAVKKRRIEIFKDAERKISVSRLFDETGRLIAGEWRRQDGVSTFYSAAKMSELGLYRTDREIIDQDAENIWRLSVTAKGFESIVDSPASVTAEERADEYQLNYRSNRETGVTKAVLIVDRNLHANKLFLTVKQNERLREFSFTETSFERKDRETVEKTIFEPNSEFLKNALTAEKNVVDAEKADKAAAESESKTISPNEISSAAATPELEVKVLQLLSNANALSGEQINITKTPAGKIQIKGIVDEKKRKDDILSALADVRSNPAVIVNIQTAEEAARNKTSKTSGAELENISVESKNSIPAGNILRNYFSSKGLTDEKIESEIRRFAGNMLAKSAQTRRSALQIKQIAERFSLSELEKMDEQTKSGWRRLIKQNAANLVQNSENLRGDLRAALSISQGNGGASVNSANDAEIIKAAGKLFEISLALDRDVRASFSSGTNNGALPVKSAAFANRLEEIIILARQLK